MRQLGFESTAEARAFMEGLGYGDDPTIRGTEMTIHEDGSASVELQSYPDPKHRCRVQIRIPDRRFQAVGSDLGAEPASWLRLVLAINGTDHHLEAIAVRSEDGLMRAEADALEDTLDTYAAAAAADRPFDTVRIGQREYVLVMTPFAGNTVR
jgi:hypothetical protein